MPTREDPTVTPSPLSGALFIVTATAHYAWSGPTTVLFPSMTVEFAEHMAAYLHQEPTGDETRYTDIRIAHCQYSEIPDVTPDAVEDLCRCGHTRDEHPEGRACLVENDEPDEFADACMAFVPAYNDTEPLF